MPNATPSNTTSPANITVSQIEEYLTLEEERKELERRARTLGTRERALADHFKSFLESKGQAEAKRGNYRVALVKGRASVSWKEELVKAIGPLAAKEIAQAAPVTQKIEVVTLS